MTGLLFLIPIALLMGGVAVAAFMWSLSNGQYNDPEGAASRILLDDDLEGQEELERQSPNASR